MQTGYIAAAVFLLFTGTGAVAQVYKLLFRTKEWRLGKVARENVCDGLTPVRELWSYTAFLLFAFSGVTRSYIDYFLICSRFPVILLSTVIIWFLAYHGIVGAKRILRFAIVGDVALISLLVICYSKYSYILPVLGPSIDIALSIVSLLLFYGKMTQAVQIFKTKRSQAVSWMREIGCIAKDVTGLWYSLGVGSDLAWVSFTHVLSGISSSSICISKYWNEKLRSDNS